MNLSINLKKSSLNLLLHVLRIYLDLLQDLVVQQEKYFYSLKKKCKRKDDIH